MTTASNRGRGGVAILVVVVAFVSPLGAAAAKSPSDSPDYWLDRAAAELPAVRAAGDESFITHERLAVALARTRGSDADRDRLVELARRREAGKPKDDSPASRFEPLFRAAYLYAHAGKDADVRRLLPALEAHLERTRGRPERGGSGTGEGTGLEPMFFGANLGLLRALLDDFETDEAAGRATIETAVILAHDGWRDKAPRVARLALARLGPPAGDEGVRDHRFMAQGLADLGLYDEARDVAGRIPRKDNRRVEAFAAVAMRCYDAGDVPDGRKAIREGLAAVAAGPAEFRTDGLASLLSIALNSGRAADRTALREVADALQAELERLRRVPNLQPGSAHPDAVMQWAEIALARAALGDRDGCGRLVDRLESAVKGARVEDAARTWLLIASVRARLGERRKAEQAVANSRTLFAVDLDTSPDEYRLPREFARAGYFEAAVASVEPITYPLSRSIEFTNIADEQVRAGKLKGAEQTAARIDDPARRLKVYRLIALRWAGSDTPGSFERLAAWIDRRGQPHERALLNLAVAERLLGVERQGMNRRLVGVP